MDLEFQFVLFTFASVTIKLDPSKHNDEYIQKKKYEAEIWSITKEFI